MQRIMSVLFSVVLTGTAAAQTDAGVIAGLAGPWQFSDAGGKTCAITFLSDAAIHGFALNADPACKEVWAQAGDLAGWTILEDGSLRLLDPLGKSLMDFPESDNGLYQHLTDGKADYSLANVDESDFTPAEP
jgi:hypothetical protein